MKKMLLTVLLILLLTGCSMPNLMGGKQADEEPPEEPSLSVNDPEDETPEKPEADRPEVSKPETGKPEKPNAPTEPSSPAAPETAGGKKGLLGLVICIGGILCLILWGLLSILLPSSAQQLGQSSMLRIDGNGMFLIACVAAVVVGAVLILKDKGKK